ncbi:MAG: DUF4835 family protein [Bacteroidia bacterium]|nr:DUF4835 family protein [Bacteroidia bacterium]
MKTALAIAAVAAISRPLWAQELNCRVNIQRPNIQGVDVTVFNNMQKEITDYMNNNRWTDHQFEALEKIPCFINIVITAMPAADRFEGTAQVQARRYAYNSSYETLTLNFNDRDFKINYVPFQTLQFSENSYVNNLCSILNFYAFVILGFDYDSYSLEGGVDFFERARNIVNLSNANGEPGWAPMTGNRNRFWLIENVLNNNYKNIHTILYRYHREGLDKMAEDVNAGRSVIMECVVELEKLFNQNQNLYFTRIFLDTKTDELINIFRRAPQADKARFVQIMTRIDAASASQYQQVLAEDASSESGGRPSGGGAPMPR